MGKNIETFRRFSELFMSGEWAKACETYMHPNLEIHEPPSLPQGGVFRGADAPIQVSKIYRGIWDLGIESLDLYEDGDVVFMRALLKWTSKKTGKSVTAPVIEANYFEDGKVVRIEVYHHDTQGMLDTLKAERRRGPASRNGPPWRTDADA